MRTHQIILAPLLSLAVACNGNDDADPTTGGEEADISAAAKASLSAIKNPTSFVLARDGIYATTSGDGIVHTDLSGKNATKVPGSLALGASRILSTDGERIVYTSQGTTSTTVAAVPKDGGPPADLGLTTTIETTSSFSGKRFFYTWYSPSSRKEAVEMLALDGSASVFIGTVGMVKNGEAPVIVGDTLFVVDSSDRQASGAAKIVAFDRAGNGWSSRDVALVPGAASLPRRGSLVAHGDSLYLAGRQGVHRIQPAAAGKTIPSPPLLVSSSDCDAERTFAVDDDGIHLACTGEDTTREIRSYNFDGTLKKVLGVVREDVGERSPVIEAVQTSADAVYVLQTLEGTRNEQSHIYRFAKK